MSNKIIQFLTGVPVNTSLPE